MKNSILTFAILLTTLLASGAATAQFLGMTTLLPGFKAASSHRSALNGHPLKRAVPFRGRFTLDLSSGVVGTGVATHIGRFTLVALDDQTNFPAITGTVTITAANGDELFATHTGVFQDLGHGRAVLDFDNTITGGTGKFAGATGSFTIHSLINQNLGTGRATLCGTIRYASCDTEVDL